MAIVNGEKRFKIQRDCKLNMNWTQKERKRKKNMRKMPMHDDDDDNNHSLFFLKRFHQKTIIAEQYLKPFLSVHGNQQMCDHFRNNRSHFGVSVEEPSSIEISTAYRMCDHWCISHNGSAIVIRSGLMHSMLNAPWLLPGDDFCRSAQFFSFSTHFSPANV